LVIHAQCCDEDAPWWRLGPPRSRTQPRILFAAAILAATEINCAKPTPTVDPDQDRVDRLVTRAYGVPVTEGYSYAVATVVCGQAGSRDVAIYLLDHSSDPIPPLTGRYLRLTLFTAWEEAGSLAHQSFRWQASRGPGDAVLCSAGACAAMNQGRVDIDAVRTGHWIEGNLDLRFTNDMLVRRHFHATWWTPATVVACE
jgi:hypothetical protein